MTTGMAAPPGVEAWWERLDPSLDYQEGIVSPPAFEDAFRDCQAAPQAWLAVSEQTGEAHRLRCKSPNKCSVCRAASARETAELLAVDAEESLPTIYAVLTCRDFLTRPQIRRHLEHVRKSLRKVWPRLEWFCALEWQKRGAIHLNLIVKGVAVSLLAHFRRRLLAIWGSRVDCVDEAQYVREIANPRHLARYVAKLAEYLGKADQSAPPGWRGHRTSQTRGYFHAPVAELRVVARASLRYKAQRNRYRRMGYSRIEAAWRAAEDVLARLGDTWRLMSILIRPGGRGPGYSEEATEPLMVGERPRWAPLREAQQVAADGHVDVGPVVRGDRLPGVEHGPHVHDCAAVRDVRRPGREEALPDGHALCDQHESGRLWGDHACVESGNRADDRNEAGWDEHGHGRARVARQELCAVDVGHDGVIHPWSELWIQGQRAGRRSRQRSRALALE